MNSPTKKLLCVVVLIGAYIIQVSFRGRELPKSGIELGRILFKDQMLSLDYSLSCESCHKEKYAFADTSALSLGINYTPTLRNTPSIVFSKDHHVFFWDGRANSLEQQATGPITNHNEMGLPVKELLKRLNASKFYSDSFFAVYGRKPDSVLLVKSIALFERSLAVYDSPYDHYLKGDNNALSESAKHGLILFFKQNSCGNPTCHNGNDFSADSLVNIGVYNDHDKGLFDLTKKQDDVGKFKTPTLRNLLVTAPYMHDGSQKTLKDVVEYYRNMKNFPENGNTSIEVKHQRNIPLTDADVDDLVEFLKSLTNYQYQPKK
jgi:cytochrome c peroxidase